MLIELLRAIERVSGAILGGLWVSLQVGNVLICVLIVLLAPAVLAGLNH